MNLKTHLDIFRVKTALKITIAGIICVLIINLFHMTFGYLSSLFVFLIMVLTHGRILVVGVQIIIGVFLSAAVSLLIAYLFYDTKVLYLLFMALWIFFCMTHIGKYFIPTLLSSIAAAISMFTTVFVSISETTLTVDNFVIQIVLAVVVAWIVDDYVWPHRTKSTLTLTLSSVFNDFSERMRSYMSGTDGGASEYMSGGVSLNTFNNLVNLVDRTAQESRGVRFPTGPYTRVVAYAKNIFIKLDLLQDYMKGKHEFLRDERVSENLDKVFAYFSEHFSRLGDEVTGGGQTELSADEIDGTLKALREAYDELHSVEGRDYDYFEDLMAFGALLPLLEDIESLLHKTSDTLNIVSSGEYERMLHERVTRTPEVEKAREQKKAFMTRQQAQQALKTVIIIFLLLLGEMFLNLPGGTQASFYGVLFGSMPNLGQAHMKGKYAIIGVIIGLMYGLLGLWLVSVVAHFPIMLLLFILGFFVAAYLASGRQTIAAAAFQAGLMMPYVLLIDSGPELALSTAKMRFLALLMATSIGLLVLHNVWPVNPYNQLKKKLSDAVRISGVIFGTLLKLDEKEKERIDSLVTPLAASLPTSTTLLADAQFLVATDKLHFEESLEIIDSLAKIYEELETLKRNVFAEMDNELLNLHLTHMAPDYKKICDYFERVSEQFAGGGDVSGEINSIKAEIVKHREEFRESGVSRRFGVEDLERTVLIATSVDGIIDSLYEISVSMARIGGVEQADQVKLSASRV